MFAKATQNTDALMGSTPIPALLRKVGLPMMLSLLVSSLYTVVDSIFVSHISEAALTALSMAAPVQTLMVALGSGIALGLNAAISKAMGAHDQKRVRDISAAAMFLAMCAYILIAAACLLFAKPFFLWQADGNTEIYEYGVTYLRICMLFSFGTMCQWVFDRLLIATGKTPLFFVTLTAASAVNLILDPILIFVFEMGIAGSAIATVCGQCCGAVAGLIVNRRFNKDIPVAFTLKPSLDCVREILRVGLPTSAMQALVGFTGIFMNTILTAFSTTAVAILGVCTRIQNLAILPVHSVNNSIVPIIAYAYGAKNRARIYECRRWALIYAASLLGVIILVLEVFPKPILSLFEASDTMLSLGVPAIRILAAGYMISVLGLISGTFFQALGRAGYSMCLMLTRQALLPVLLVSLLARFGIIELIWTAYVAAELLALPLVFLFMRRIKRQVLDADF